VIHAQPEGEARVSPRGLEVSMRKLELEEIEKFASRAGVKKIAVENFLMSMGDNPINAQLNLGIDTRLYSWNSQTVKAIQDGIRLACKF